MTLIKLFTANFTLNTYLKYHQFYLIFILINCQLISSISGQNKEDLDYKKYIKLAENSINEQPKLAATYLDSIPQPFDKTIKGRIADYYHLKAVINNYLNQEAEVYHNNLLALNFAEKEKNYNVAGTACLELFYNLYIIKKDSTAFDYLKKAKKYYTIDTNQNGLTEVMQMEAFAEYYNNNYKKSNALILPKLGHYKSIKDDQYYYLYALFMLTSNYIYLGDEVNNQKYFEEFKKLESDPTIPTLLYKKHEVTLYISKADMYLSRKLLDSTSVYLQKADALRQYMNNSDVENYFEHTISYYDILNNTEAKSNYLDSLKLFQQKMISSTIDASFNINKTLLETKQNLDVESENNYLNRNWIIALIALLIAVILFVFARYKNIRNILNDFSKKTAEYSSLQNKHNKLKAKVIGLEDYLIELKKEFKTISAVSDPIAQRKLITAFYTKLHGDSTSIINTNENFIEKLSQENSVFFIKINQLFPQLNEDEKIICYYIFAGFKNKEIAIFLKTTVRAIESKRYRIYKKIDFENTKESFPEFLVLTIQ